MKQRGMLLLGVGMQDESESRDRSRRKSAAGTQIAGSGRGGLGECLVRLPRAEPAATGAAETQVTVRLVADREPAVHDARGELAQLTLEGVTLRCVVAHRHRLASPLQE